MVDQLDFDWGGNQKSKSAFTENISEEVATLLFMIDTLNKHLFEVDTMPARKVRETLDGFTKEIIQAKNNKDLAEVLFRFRQFFSSHRIGEYTYVISTFDDFRGIIWDFVDQMTDDLTDEKKEDQYVKVQLEKLKEAVEDNAIDEIKTHSRQFIDIYTQVQNKKEKRRSKRFESVKKNLDVMKKQLVDANNNMRVDPLTGAVNRRGYDEYIEHCLKMIKAESKSAVILAIDIDHFKKVNDTFGHATGDFILQELTRMLKECFSRKEDLVARIGGEEFVVVLPGFQLDHALAKAEMCLTKIRHETFIKDSAKINFTVSMGIAEYIDGESAEQWLKRADQALYQAKNSGRNKYVVSKQNLDQEVA